MKGDAQQDYEALFAGYSAALNARPSRESVLNYMSSHDDSMPFDALRARPFETATKLLLAPGAAQIYYGDETARVLRSEGAEGDANLRSFMNWDDLAKNAQRTGYRVADVRDHWAKLGQFRRAHPAVGAGVHQMIQHSPYVFKRTYEKNGVSDKVVVALGLPTDKRSNIPVRGVFGDGQTVRDAYSGTSAVVAGGMVQFPAQNAIVLIGY